MIRWTCTPPPAAAVSVLADTLKLSPVLANLLAARGLTEQKSAEAFLRPRLQELDDPFRLPELEQGARLLDEAITAKKQVLVFGDYDVDGVTSTALLVSVLRVFGLEPRYAVPRRLDEGYGLSLPALQRVLGGGVPDLFIALDCGTNAADEVAWLREQGCEVIIVDHHRSKSGVPHDCTLINPCLDDKEDGFWGYLCTVGLVFKLAHGLLKIRRAAGDARAHAFKLADALDLVALGTIADLVPLIGENRILARYGMKVLEKCDRPGLRALFAVSGLQPGQGLASSDISYRLGPRINASGRLADAALPVELLLASDMSECSQTAATLDTLNRERQNIERQVTAEAERLVEETQRDAPALVVFGENWHPGVVGIVAGKLCRQYARPCIVLGREGPLAKGSGRSIPGLNLVEVLQPCAHMLTHWGGHPMAVGIAVDASRLAEFHTTFAETVRERRARLTEDFSAMELSAWIEPSDLHEELLRELELLHPFGEANPEPVFGVRGVRLAKPPEIFPGDNYRCWVPTPNSRPVSAVAWKKASRLPPAGEPLDLAVKFYWNFWNGRQHPQLEILDWRAAQR